MIITVDFETFYSKEYSLTKGTTEEYVRDDRFEVIGVGVKVDDAPTEWFSGTHEETAEFLSKFDWENSFVLAHNTMFDGAILSWRFGIKPMAWLDTLCMARAVDNEASNSLAKLAQRLGVGEKGSEVMLMVGKRRADFTADEMGRYAKYCCNDVDLCYEIYNILKANFSVKELKLIDLTLKMYTDPSLQLNLPLLEQHLEEVKARKEALIAKAAADRDTLLSNQKFAAKLLALGVDPPVKISPTTGKPALALAKSDEGFKALAEHPNEEVQALVAARLGTKSTLEETRTERFISIAKRGSLPVPLRYYAAHTGRWGGDDKLNLQNLPRKSKLKDAIVPPDGYVLIDADSSQIEARTVAWLAGQTDLVQAFENGEDVYKIMASKIYHKPIDKIDAAERFVGKTTILGCFGPDTKVLTSRGWKCIVDVQATDMLWDGEEWVSHQGVVPQGKKEVITAYGVSATPDHEILTEHGWQEWQEVITNPSLFQSALSKVNLPSSTGDNIQNQLGVRRGGIQLCDVVVGGKVKWTDRTSKQKELQGVILVQKSLAQKLESIIGGTKQFFLTNNIGQGCLTGLHLAYQDATHQHQKYTGITEGVGYSSTNRGERTAQHFLNILSRLTVGTTRKKKLTGLMSTKDMSQTISDLQRDQKTCQTDEKQKICKQKLITYDIAYAGPRNRYTIATGAGAIIVHNCGYGMGWKKFQIQLKTFGVEMPDHLCKHIVNTYRDAYPRIPFLWQQGGDCLEALASEDLKTANFGVQVQAVSLLPGVGFDLPSGLPLKYMNLRMVEEYNQKTGLTEKQYIYDTRKGTTKIYGGKVVENLCQAIARCIIGEQMLKIAKRYKVVLTVHDAVACIAKEEEVDEAVAYVTECMRWRPKWAQTLPLNCEVGFGKSYGEC